MPDGPDPNDGSPPATPTPTPGTLRNPSFEEADGGVLRDWRVYGGHLEQSARYAAHGSYSARLSSNTPSTKWAYQLVSIRGGAFYELSAFGLVAEGGGGTAFLRISWYGTPDGSGRSLGSVDSLTSVSGPAAEMTHLTTGPVVAPEAARSARLRLMLAPSSASPTVAHFDAVAFGETADDGPAPPNGVARSPQRSEVAGISRSGRVDPATLVPSPHTVKVNEVAFSPATAGEERDYEWVELFNPGPLPVSLAGWSLADNTRRTPLPAGTLQPGGFLVIAATDRFLEIYPGAPELVATLDGTIGNGLANTGDRVLLLDAEGRLVDAMSYGRDDGIFAVPPEAPAHASLERRPFGHDTDEAEDFSPNRRPTPGYGLQAGPRASEVAGGNAAVRPPGILEYRLPEQGGRPPVIGYLIGLSILVPVLTLAAARLWARWLG
jgi:hypothetical protein